MAEIQSWNDDGSLMSDWGKNHMLNHWLREDYPYADVSCPEGLSAQVDTCSDDQLTRTTIRITNTTHKPIFTSRDSIGITLPIDNRYEKTDICLTSRAHVHLFCGGNVSWVMAMRMGGKAPHLGLVLTEGSLDGYSISHNGPMANDRGCFILHPSADQWKPGETKTISWTVFEHDGKDDFFGKLPLYCKRFVRVESDRYVLFPGEALTLTVHPSFTCKQITADGLPIKNGQLRWQADQIGEHVFHINADGVRTWCRVLVTLPPMALADKRVRFIRDHQQYHGDIDCLEGAYLAYDNDEEQLVLTPFNDANGGRERVGMGILLARYLSMGGEDDDLSIRQSLDSYTDYVLRELMDEESGEVFNDLTRDNSYRRTYNYPWFVTFFLERYYLTGSRRDLKRAYTVIRRFYENEDGAHFYPIELPLVKLYQALQAEGFGKECDCLLNWAVSHAWNILKTGVHYPPFEVAFEQTIVGPAVDILLKVYEMTGNPLYLKASKSHLRLLELFNGCQPDYHRYEVAVRNWDGYWFGKWMLFGDTFPHYWSGVTGNCFAHYAQLTGDNTYRKRAEDSLRAVLPLIFPDGRASCAYLYPVKSNGIRAEAYDPRANDQDWGLYFYLRFADTRK